jgi:uncharacterized MAPEG superfamily protein
MVAEVWLTACKKKARPTAPRRLGTARRNQSETFPTYAAEITVLDV